MAFRIKLSRHRRLKAHWVGGSYAYRAVTTLIGLRGDRSMFGIYEGPQCRGGWQGWKPRTLNSDRRPEPDNL